MIKIGERQIGANRPCYIIAEAGLNHNGDPDLAKELIRQAAACGADAVKFQTYTPEELFPPDHPDYAKFQQCVFSREVYASLQETARAHHITLLSTPFDEASADLLESLQLPAFKIGSGELTHLAFLAYVAGKGKPMIVSTGMATLEQILAAVDTLRNAGNTELALLHCVSAYPCPAEQAHVCMVKRLGDVFSFPIGYSDHTMTDTAAIAAVALGACIIEKHFTLSHDLPGWDHFFSYDPTQFSRFVEVIHETGQIVGDKEKKVWGAEQPIERIARRALYTRNELKAGHILTKDDIVIRRPMGPIPAEQLDRVIGRTLDNDLPAQSPLSPNDFS
ncbi:N-acetylneuraminate synthase [bacterium]|nr:N-acetylneuraminate synthase [bacterium]